MLSVRDWDPTSGDGGRVFWSSTKEYPGVPRCLVVVGSGRRSTQSKSPSLASVPGPFPNLSGPLLRPTILPTGGVGLDDLPHVP